MAIQRLVIDGFGQIEPNNVTFTRDGRIEAQCALNKADFTEAVAENGMLLAVDTASREVKLPVDDKLPIAIHYSTEKIYNQFTPGLKNFKLDAKSGYCPRMGFLTIGETFTSNCIAYDTDEFTDDAALKEAIANKTVLYAGACENGAIKISATKPAFGPVLRVAAATTMPDGQYAVEFHVQ